MKPNQILVLFFLSSASILLADHPDPQNPDPIVKSANLWDPSRPDSHAPIGVMADHTHGGGEVMLSYRYMHMAMEGHRAGTNSLTTHQVFERGFDVAATQMDTHMHMFGAMFAPADWLTLLAMANYVEKDMHLTARPRPAHGHGHGGGHGHTGSFGHSSAGLGDVSVGALVKIYDANRQRIHLNLGLGLPTADVDEKQDGVFLPYGMQLGSGTWDLRPGITYLGQSGGLSWGLQTIGNFRLEDENESGFGLGNSVNSTGWLAIPLADWLSLSGRLSYLHQEAIDGHYNGPHAHAAPPHFPENYGGDFLDGGIGLNFYGRQGFLRAHRFAAEVLFPLVQDLNGVGMERDYSFVVGWQKAW